MLPSSNVRYGIRKFGALLLTVALFFIFFMTGVATSFGLALAANQRNVIVRRFQSQDAPIVSQLFHDTVRTVNLGDYSESQVQAWAPDDVTKIRGNWTHVCQNRFTIVAEVDGGVIAGFAELLNQDNDGLQEIDCFYCHKDYQRQGIGRLLYEAIEQQARHRHCPSIMMVEASITAKPFFARMGFQLVKEQIVFCRGQSFANFRMEKLLEQDPKVSDR